MIDPMNEKNFEPYISSSYSIEETKNEDRVFFIGNKELYDKFTRNVSIILGRSNNFVYEVINKEDESIREALKEINFNKYPFESFQKEIDLLEKTKNFPHPNLIKFRGSFVLNSTEFYCGKYYKTQFGCIQMEKGIKSLDQEIHQKITKKRCNELTLNFSSEELMKFIQQMIAAHSHLQSINIVHRDIKPSNILIFDFEKPLFKVCDIGAGYYLFF